MFSQNEMEEGKLVGMGEVEQIFQIYKLILQSYPFIENYGREED